MNHPVPAFSNPTLGAAESLTRGLFWNCIYNLLKNSLDWREQRRHYCYESSSSSLRGGGNVKIFSLWENTLNLTTCSGCNVPVKLAKKKNLEVECALKHRPPNIERESYGRALSQYLKWFYLRLRSFMLLNVSHELVSSVQACFRSSREVIMAMASLCFQH